jgi:hypothetical protein
MTIINISKLEAARRQISVSIDLLFNDGDLVAAHTLAGAASVILFDLMEHQKPGQSIERQTSSIDGGSLKELLKIFSYSTKFFQARKRRS